MKSKRGFTLIEILIVLVVLVTVTAGATIGIKEIQKRSEERNLRELYTMIETAADTYLSINDEYREELLNEEVTERCTRIYTLQNEGLLSNDLSNPVTKKRIPGNLCVISYINDEGLIENHFDLDDDLKVHKVTLVVNGGKADAEYKNVYTKAIFDITADEKMFILNGVCDGGATVKIDNFKVVVYGVKKDQTCIVNLKNKQNKVTVEVVNGISSPTESIVEYGKSANFSLLPSIGYEFDSLDCKNGKIEGSTLVVSNVTEDTLCKVNYKIKEFNITIEAKNGKASPVNINASYGSNSVINLETTKGYTVEGTTTTCEGAVIDLANKTLTIQNVTKSQVCTVTFNPITYTVTLDNQVATFAGTTLVYYKYNTAKKMNGTNYYYFSDKSLTSALSSITKPTKTGYTFGGYFTNTNGAGTDYISANGTFSNNLYKTINVKVLYAKWSLNQYKLTLTKGTGISAIYYKVNGASSYTKVTATTTLNVNYNSRYYYYAEATAGYSLSACTSSTPCEGTMGSSAVNKTLSANIISYKVTLTVSGGAGSTSKNINYNSSGTFTGVKPNSGYTATGATLTCNGGATIGLSGTTVTVSKVTKMQTCTVTFKSNIKLLDKLLADNPTRKTRTDFSKRFAADNTKTLYTSTETISGISSTKTVYYFAGNAKNNWVKFGNYLWRIIRTNHDSSIRLLYSGTVEQGVNNTDGVIAYNMTFNEDNNSPKYVGYMYGSSDSSLDNIRGNTVSSTIKSYIDSWYKATDLYGDFVSSDLQNYHLDSKFKLRFKLQNYENYLSKDAVYCADRNLASGYSYSRSGEFLFKIEDRIPDWYSLSDMTPKPTYDCTNIKDAFSGNNTKAQLKCADGSGICPVGLMTADEVTFAGGINDYNFSEPFPWYMKNISSIYWLMTPARYDKPYGKSEAYAGTSTVKKDGSAGAYYVTNLGWVRPVTSLKSCVLWKNGDGSASAPYEIIENGGC